MCKLLLGATLRMLNIFRIYVNCIVCAEINEIFLSKRKTIK